MAKERLLDVVNSNGKKWNENKLRQTFHNINILYEKAHGFANEAEGIEYDKKTKTLARHKNTFVTITASILWIYWVTYIAL